MGPPPRSFDRGPLATYKKCDLSEVPLTAVDKAFLGRVVVEKLATVAQLAEWFSLGDAALYKYAKTFKDGGTFTDGTKGGRPPLVNVTNIAVLKDKVQKAARSLKALPSREFDSLLGHAIRSTNADRGGNLLATYVAFDVVPKVRNLNTTW